MSEYSLEEIRETIRLEELLLDLDIPVVRANTKGWQNTACPLPTHVGQDANPSFGINEEYLTFCCFACDETGSIFKLASILKELSYDEAVEYILTFTDLEAGLIDDDGTKFMERIKDILEKERDRSKVRVEVLPYFSPEALSDYQYCGIEALQKWRVRSLNTVKAFGLRYNALHERGSHVGPAILVPHYVKGDLVGWQERWLGDRPESLPKYTNTSDFPRRTTLYNQDRALSLNGPVLVVESAATVWRLFELDYTAVATFGGSVTDEQQRILQQFETIILAYDNDRTGRKADKALGEYLSDYTDVYKVPFPAEQKGDLADLEDDEIHRLIDGAKHYLELTWRNIG